MTPAEALAQARSAGLARVDAVALLQAASGRSRSWLIAHDDEALDDAGAQRWAEWLVRRLAGEPVAYLIGGHEFHGLWLEVNADVLDPRPDTETLVDWALERLRASTHAAPRVLDLGTGSGAIALAIKQAHPCAEVVGVDLSERALAVARRNGERLGLAVRWLQGSWWQALAAPDAMTMPGSARRFDLVVSNPPYIAQGDIHLAALRHEPRSALVAGPDGLDDLRLIVAAAGDWLTPGGWLLLEHGHDQAAAVAALLLQPRDAGAWQAITHRLDLAGVQRCTGARWQPGNRIG